MEEVFLNIIRLGLREANPSSFVSERADWLAIEAVAEQHGLLPILMDGVEQLPDNFRPPKDVLLQWIGITMQEESTFSLQNAVAKDVALLFYRNGIVTYILKGAVVSECYPNPNHRVSVDIDCYLLPEKGDFDAWSLGNDLIRTKGFKVNEDYYKNSSFDISGVKIENHHYFTPFRGNKKLAEFENLLHALIRQNRVESFEGTHLYKPPVFVTSLFLIEHAYSHFLHEGLTWRHILDWAMFSKRHKNEITWADLHALIDEYGFMKFYDSYNRLGQYALGEIKKEALTKPDMKMLADVWAPLDLHETLTGVKGKLALAGNTWRARWKYHYFSDISWIKALWIQAKGVLFEKHPTLD